MHSIISPGSYFICLKIYLDEKTHSERDFHVVANPVKRHSFAWSSMLDAAGVNIAAFSCHMKKMKHLFP